MLIFQIQQIFCWKNVRSFCSAKASLIFSKKNFSVFGYKVVKRLTSWPLNELVKLTMLWTTGPRSTHAYRVDLYRESGHNVFTVTNDGIYVNVSGYQTWYLRILYDCTHFLCFRLHACQKSLSLTLFPSKMKYKLIGYNNSWIILGPMAWKILLFYFSLF